MKAKEILKLLNICRPTLTNYVKTGKIRAKRLESGHYIYDKESVFKLINKSCIRQIVLYARVSTAKQKQDLENQVDILKAFCLKNGLVVSNIYKDIGSGINFDRKGFSNLLDDVIDYKIQRVIITYKDRLSRISFSLFKNLFEKYGTELIILNEINDEKLVEKEIFNEIIGLIHCFSMKVYSNRRKDRLKLVEKQLKLDEPCNE
jgi:putative resolvase